ncbi:hypothetical protein GCM10010971_09860 [Silvimonas amylolytica]|uniref:Uncharacterized protein n=1 Tax=Silvimonas amylolytica TaxID=449663 RepID=A0ABQ2PHT0_9NEIS|nr:hypothetical protein GCM10010971_09860 [Silvimonas amylolytica]
MQALQRDEVSGKSMNMTLVYSQFIDALNRCRTWEDREEKVADGAATKTTTL